MYVCQSCGRLFDEPEHFTEAHGFTDGMVEEWDGCPYCGESGYAKIESCAYCGKPTRTDDFYHGYCKDCLKLKCTYDAALDFMESHDLLGQFFCWYFNDGFEPAAFNQDFLEVFAEIYRRRKANDLLTGSHEWLDAIQKFILDDDGDFGKDGFAKFLLETEREP